MGFAGLYPWSTRARPVRDDLEKLRHDFDRRPSIFEPGKTLRRPGTSASACGFLACLHLEMCRNAWSAEFISDLIPATTDTGVRYRLTANSGEIIEAQNSDKSPTEYDQGRFESPLSTPRATQAELRAAI